MQHIVRAARSVDTCLGVPDVSLNEREPAPRYVHDLVMYLVEVLTVSGREVVEADDVLAEFEQFSYEVGPYESGGTCYEPSGGVFHDRPGPLRLVHVTASTR